MSPLRNAFENLAVETKQVEANGILATIRDSIFRRTDPIAPGTNLIGNVGSIVGTQVGLGRLFFANSGRLVVQGGLSGGGNMRGTLTNPTGSGKNLVVLQLSAFSTAQGWAMLYANPNTGLPTTTRPANNAIIGGGLAPVGVMRADTNGTTALSGGLDTGVALGIPGGRERVVQLSPFILAPGVSLGLNLPFTVDCQASFTLYWYESPA